MLCSILRSSFWISYSRTADRADVVVAYLIIRSLGPGDKMKTQSDPIAKSCSSHAENNTKITLSAETESLDCAFLEEKAQSCFRFSE